MIEIKCTAEEKKRLLEVLNTKELPCPFVGLCTELPYYKTGMTHRECIENNIKWTITEAKAEKCGLLDKKITITEAKLLEVISNAAVEYYEPQKGGQNLREFIMRTGLVAVVSQKLFKEEK